MTITSLQTSARVPTRPWILAVSAVLLAAGCGTGERPASDADTAYADEMAEQHAEDRPEPSRAALGEPAQEVAAREVVYGRVGDRDVTGYLARPEGAAPAGPGIIVIHEWWGLNDNIRSMTRQLAGRGYAALAVDLYGGEVAEEPSAAQQLVSGVMEDREAARENLRAAYAYLTDEVGSERVGVIGWCFGGMWSLRTALLLPEELDATVVYYGPPVTDPERLRILQMPILGHFGMEDGSIPPDTVRRFAAVLDSLGVENSVHLYGGAGHAFANPSGTRYRPEAADTAWNRTLEFLARHLGREGGSS